MITTIHEYGEKQNLRDALIRAVSDRLRPVFLTSATTVLGLTPLMFEQSRQAQFLLPHASDAARFSFAYRRAVQAVRPPGKQ